MSTTVHRNRPRSRKQKAIALKVQRRRSAKLFAAGTAILVALLVLAIMVTRGGTDRGSSGVETRSVTVAGGSLPGFADTDDPGVGLPIPEVKGGSFDGATIEIENNGIPKMLIFLAHWCPHCQAEVPVVQAWIEQEGFPQGVDLISIATATDPAQPNYPPSEWLESEGWMVPVLVDDPGSTVGEAFGVTSYPFFVFVDGEGDVHHRAAGELPIEAIETVLGELTPPKT
jgi:cytochrome c biogenesis protein CcmG/thiol:disulfide interchange protein DsbE